MIAPGVRQPRGLVKVNGAVIAGMLYWETDENEHSSPSTFRACFAISGLPASNDIAWFSAQTDLTVEIFAGFPADPTTFSDGELESVFFGKVDDVAADWLNLTLDLTGRDMSAPLLDNKSSEKYINSTASAIAAKLAQKYGLTPNVTATTTRVGVYYKQDHVDLKDDRTEWDLLLWLARKEGFQLYVSGKTLYFGPQQSSGTPYVFQKTGNAWNATSVKASHTLTVAKDIEVSATSWNPTKKLAYTRKATRSRKGSGLTQKYSYRFANLTPEQTQQRANQILADLSRHEMKVAIEGPADVGLAIGGSLQIAGTGTAFDQTYFPSSIHRFLRADGGYHWTIDAKNHAPENSPNL